MYSLEQLLAPPPLSALLSIALVAGLDCLGLVFLRRSALLSFNPHNSSSDAGDDLRWQAIVVGAMLLATVLFPMVLFGVASRFMMQGVAICLLVAGTLHLVLVSCHCFRLWNSLSAWIGQNFFPRLIILSLVIGMFLLALGPVTNADALDYHIGAAIAMLNNGGMPGHPEWFHSRLAGNGEVLNALGLAVGAEQFGALLQFASLIAVVGLMLTAQRRPAVYSVSAGDLVLLAVLSSPVLLFLISAPKPQLWPIAMTTLAFALLVHPSVNHLDKRALWARYALVCALCMSATQAKFNFLLGGGIVGGLAVYTMLWRRQLVPAILIAVLISMTVMLPSLVWKAHTYGASLLDSLLSPLPGHLPGTDRMIAYARNNPDFVSVFPFPISILLPSNAGGVTTVLGIGWILFFWWRPQACDRVSGTTVLLAILATAIAAPPSARMYLEPYFWILFLFSLQLAWNSPTFPSWVRWAIWLQTGGCVMACWFGVFTLFPGALTTAWRTKIMERSANGYDLMRWADQVLPADAVLINGHRSMALAPRKALDYSWTNQVDPASTEAMPYLLAIKAAGVSHILLPDRIANQLPLSGCFGSVFAGPGPGRLVSRNPFNQGSSYEAWILEFYADRLPGCALQKGAFNTSLPSQASGRFANELASKL